MLVAGFLSSALILPAIAAVFPSGGPGYWGKGHGHMGGKTNLYVSSYVGTVTTLSLSGTNLDITSSVPCAQNASWLTFDSQDRILYCLDEGLVVPNGTVHSYSVAKDGKLTPIEEKTTISGPVNGVLYDKHDGKQGYALAHYTGSAVSVWSVDEKGSLDNVQDIFFTLPHPGPNPSRQDAPHEHEAILDPTKKYILVPDLGADLVRVFCYDPETFKLTAHEPLHAKAGSGPRHAAFWVNKGKTYMYLVAELGVTVTAYEVTYVKEGGLSFKEIEVSNTFGGAPIPDGAAPAEIQVSPDQRFIVISNRNDSSFFLPNFDPKNKTAEPSDSLATFALKEDGTLDFHGLAPAGGSFPRQFSLNGDGSLVGVGLQFSSRVVVIERDIKTGVIGKIVAHVPLPGQITCVVWDEQ
ncbi:3-carboxymuconate cyclase-like protein-like protein [Rhizodiscina lignyota]|uniref:3-carboxymuconate cyclase-like protein-like protein n=1 Tax=Rhizodiscina lignyota TaxID=1504668 RepID=A0A9P4MF53_9PEZI|nr:3-carboxymuconate cyclase-like protein-like protein [Rhizodiscina lignyota]